MRKNFFFLALLISSPVWAHPSDVASSAGFFAGLLHPLTGLDHLLAMFGLGLWSATHTKRIYRAPLLFVCTLLIGACLAQAGLHLPLIEPMIAASVLLLGLMLAMQRKLPELLSALMVISFALFHGAAHGVELAADSALAGMLLATLALHLAGVWLGSQMQKKSQWWQSIVGAVMALAGAGLLLANVN